MKSYLKDREIQNNLKRIENYKNSVDKPLYDLKNIETYEVQIKINNSLEHGQFKNDPDQDHIWYTTSQTFKAMKKNIFSLDENDLDLQKLISCKSCNTELDEQFWTFCPYCGSSF